MISENRNVKLLQKARMRHQNHIDNLNRRKRDYEATILDLKIKLKSIDLLIQDSQTSVQRLDDEIIQENQKNEKEAELISEENFESQEAKA